MKISRKNESFYRYPFSRLLAGVFLIVLLAAACTSVPVTGRQQLILVSNSTLIPMSLKEYDKFLKEHKLSDNETDTRRLKGWGCASRKRCSSNFLKGECRTCWKDINGSSIWVKARR
jgi:hypothetical protein